MEEEKKDDKKKEEIVKEAGQGDMRHVQPHIKRYVYDKDGNLIRRERE